MNPRNLAVLLTSLLLGAAVAACGAAAGTGDDGGAGVGAECGGNGDCSGNLQCLASERVCVETCAPGGSDCGGDACIPLNDTVGYCDFSAAVNNGGGNNGGGNNGGTVNNGGNNGGATSDCASVFDCLGGCDQTDQACAEACLDAASPDGQALANAVLQCVNTACADAADDAAFQACANANCATEITACFGGGGNNGAGGDLLCLQDCAGNADCPAEQSCVDVTGQGNMECVEGQNVPADAPACNPDGSCAAGSTCFEVGGGGGNNGGGQDGFCLQPCAATADCPAGQTCVDVTGQGNMECVEGQNVPADAPSCNGTTPCPEGWDGCFVQGK